MTNPLTITVYGLATDGRDGTEIQLSLQTADITIDLTTIPAVAALIERNAVLEAFVAKIAGAVTMDQVMEDDAPADRKDLTREYFSWAESDTLLEDLDRLDGYITEARHLASPTHVKAAPDLGKEGGAA